MELSPKMMAFADQLIASVKQYVGDALAARAHATEQTQRGLIERLDKQALLFESLERRASRHADHLSALESRLKKLEHS